MEFDNSKLIERIDHLYDTRKAFAADLGISPQTLNKKLKGAGQFTVGEMIKAGQLLELTAAEVNEFFFTKKKQRGEV